MRLVEDEAVTAKLDLAAVDAPPMGMIAKRSRKRSFKGQKTNHESGPYNQRRKMSQMTVVIKI